MPTKEIHVWFDETSEPPAKWVVSLSDDDYSETLETFPAFNMLAALNRAILTGINRKLPVFKISEDGAKEPIGY